MLPYPEPPIRKPRPWLPAGIISAGIVIAGIVVGAAVIANNNSDQNNNTAEPGVNGSSVTGTTSTCDTWITTRAALRAVPDLPVGWNWETPNMDI